MFKNKHEGKFIAIEGLDGSGATTQAMKISEWLKRSVWLTQEPTNGVIGAMIKSALTGDWKMDNPAGLQLLFAADRANHLEKEIIPRLEKGINVITDRYFLSSIAYGSLEIDDTEWLFHINEQFLLPDLTILVAATAKTCAKRLKDDFRTLALANNEEKMQKVWQTYEKISKKYPNIKVVDGEKEEEEIFEEIKKEIGKIIK